MSSDTEKVDLNNNSENNFKLCSVISTIRHFRYRYLGSRRVIRAIFLTFVFSLIAALWYFDDSITDSITTAGSTSLEKSIKKVNKSSSNKAESQIVFFNRVPKCGSITMTRLMYQLGAKNNFQVFSPYEEGERPWLNTTQQQTIADWIIEKPKPLMYIRHVYHVNFRRLLWGLPNQPLHLNIIRDPVQRFVSFYHFIRFGNEEGDGADVPMSEEKRTTTINDCILDKKNNECQRPIWQLVPYLCGQDPVCRTRSREAVDIAKRNVENDYVLVGLLEELTMTLKILGKVVPVFFDGGVEVLNDPSQIKNDTYTLHKQKPTVQATELLKEKLSLEYDLYEFVKSRFWEKAKQLELI